MELGVTAGVVAVGVVGSGLPSNSDIAVRGVLVIGCACRGAEVACASSGGGVVAVRIDPAGETSPRGVVGGDCFGLATGVRLVVFVCGSAMLYEVLGVIDTRVLIGGNPGGMVSNGEPGALGGLDSVMDM